MLLENVVPDSCSDPEVSDALKARRAIANNGEKTMVKRLTRKDRSRAASRSREGSLNSNPTEEVQGREKVPAVDEIPPKKQEEFSDVLGDLVEDEERKTWKENKPCKESFTNYQIKTPSSVSSAEECYEKIVDAEVEKRDEQEFIDVLGDSVEEEKRKT